MEKYIQFTTVSGHTILVEADLDEVKTSQGVVKVGLKDKIKDAVGVAEETFDEAVKRIVHDNATALLHAVGELPERPDEIEISFGLKATGEIGNFAVAKAGGEASYSIKLVWTQKSDAGQENG